MPCLAARGLLWLILNLLYSITKKNELILKEGCLLWETRHHNFITDRITGGVARNSSWNHKDEMCGGQRLTWTLKEWFHCAKFVILRDPTQ